jgi:hypothetical protein
MEEWSKDFFKLLETMAGEVGQFFEDFTQEMEEAIDAFTQLSEEIVEEMQSAISTEVEQGFDEFVEPFLVIFLELEDFNEDGLGLSDQPEEPLLNQHPACVGCHHYHGHVYGGTPLICGMHPYGWDGDTCPDWESTEMS